MTAALHHHVDPHGPLVAESDAPRANKPVLVVLVAIVVGLTLLVAAFLQSQLVVGQHRVQELDRARLEQESLLENDRLDLMVARAPHTIAHEAERLGMVPADGPVILGPDGTAVATHTGSDR